MQTKTENVCVTKLVDFIPRILEQLDLQFYYFSTNFYTFLKFTDFENLRLRYFCGLDLRTFRIHCNQVPGSPEKETGRGIDRRSGLGTHRRRARGG